MTSCLLLTDIVAIYLEKHGELVICAEAFTETSSRQEQSSKQMAKNLEEKNPFTNVTYFPMLFLSLLNPLFSSYHLLSSVVSGKLDVDCLSASCPAFSFAGFAFGWAAAQQSQRQNGNQQKYQIFFHVSFPIKSYLPLTICFHLSCRGSLKLTVDRRLQPGPVCRHPLAAWRQRRLPERRARSEFGAIAPPDCSPTD